MPCRGTLTRMRLPLLVLVSIAAINRCQILPKQHPLHL